MEQSVKTEKLRIRGQKFLSKGNAERALLYFERALMLSDEPADRFNFAIALIALHRFEEAETYLADLYNSYPENEITTLSYGDCLMMLRKWDDALKLFASLSKAKPDKQSYRDYLKRAEDPILREHYVLSRELIFDGLRAIDTKQFPVAEKLFEKAKQIDPDNPTILSNLGSLLLKKKEFVRAHQLFTQALKFAPENITIQKNLKQARNRIRLKQ